MLCDGGQIRRENCTKNAQRIGLTEAKIPFVNAASFMLEIIVLVECASKKNYTYNGIMAAQ